MVSTRANVEAMALYAGQSVDLVTQSLSAADILNTVASEAVQMLQHCASLIELEG